MVPNQPLYVGIMRLIRLFNTSSKQPAVATNKGAAATAYVRRIQAARAGLHIAVVWRNQVQINKINLTS